MSEAKSGTQDRGHLLEPRTAEWRIRLVGVTAGAALVLGFGISALAGPVGAGESGDAVETGALTVEDAEIIEPLVVTRSASTAD